MLYVAGYTTVLQLLLSFGASLNEIDDRKRTALILAAHEGHVAVVEQLTCAGASVHLKSFEGCTALHYAALFGHIDCAEKLLEKEADVNVYDNHGDTPLNLAAKEGTYIHTYNTAWHGATQYAATHTKATQYEEMQCHATECKLHISSGNNTAPRIGSSYWSSRDNQLKVLLVLLALLELVMLVHSTVQVSEYSHWIERKVIPIPVGLVIIRTKN